MTLYNFEWELCSTCGRPSWISIHFIHQDTKSLRKKFGDWHPFVGSGRYMIADDMAVC